MAEAEASSKCHACSILEPLHLPQSRSSRPSEAVGAVVDFFGITFSSAFPDRSGTRDSKGATTAATDDAYFGRASGRDGSVVR